MSKNIRKSSSVLLDTHTWVWWVNGSKELSEKAQKYIDHAIEEKSVFLSTISVWEVALLVDKGRLQLTMDVQDWIAQTEALPFVHMISLDVAIAIKSVRLPGNFHKDPADRIIVATALRLGLPIITCDNKIQDYSYVKSIWD